MLVKYLSIATASGSMGGQTASHNRGGQYLRARTVPTNPGTEQQQAIRTIFGNLATAWQTLTDAQRAAWKTYADNVPVLNKFGDPIYLTGQQMFVRCNSARIQAGLARVDDGPVTYAMDSLSPVVFAAADTLDLLNVTFDTGDEWVDEDGAGLLVYASIQKAPSINYHRGPYRFTGIIEGDSTTPPTSPEAFTSLYQLDSGNVVFSRCLSVRADGRISPVQFAGPINIV